MKREISIALLVIGLLTGCTKVYEEGNACLNNKPPAPVIANVVLPAGNITTVTAVSSAGATFAWTGPGNFSSTQNPLTLDFTNITNYGRYTVVASFNGCSSAIDTFYVTASAIITPPPCTISPANYNTLQVSDGNSYVMTGGTFHNYASSLCTYDYTHDINAISTSGAYNFDLNFTNAASLGGYYSLTSGCTLNILQASATITNSIGTLIYQSVSGRAYCDTIGGGYSITFCGATFQRMSDGANVTVTGNIQYQ